MTKNVFLTAVIASFIAAAASAQTTTFDNRGAAETAVEDLEEQMADDRERELADFGNEGRDLGSYGSVALRATATSNDGEDTSDVGIGLRYGFYDGVNGYDVSLNYTYGKANDEVTKDRLLIGGDYRRDFGAAFFAYGQADLSFDNQTTTVGEYSQDIFAGVGIGYRLYNTNDFQWSIQAGPGYRLAEVVGGNEVSEVAASVSNNIFYSVNDAVYLTNDTDVIYSEFATTISNDLAVNVSLTDTLALRTSYNTRFNDQTDDSFSDGENTFGVSVVYNFN